MIDSVIATSHHYYVIYLRFKKSITFSDLLKCFTQNPLVKNSYSETAHNLTHLQLELPYLLGIENVLQVNKGGFYDNKQHYWYDFYISNISSTNKSDYILCYPYTKLSDFIEYCFNQKVLEMLVLKPQVPELLNYLKDRGKVPANIQKSGFVLDIIKYSAAINEEMNAKKLIIFGENPLESRVFEIVNNDSQLKVEPLSLRLKCSLNSSEILEISFDKLGNGRFWMKKNHQNNITTILPSVLQLFYEINGLKQSLYINSYSLLESPDE